MLGGGPAGIAAAVAAARAGSSTMLGKSGFEVVGSSPEEFTGFIRSESEKWARIVKLTGAKAE